jgi:hypothetical protein
MPEAIRTAAAAKTVFLKIIATLHASGRTNADPFNMHMLADDCVTSTG